MNCTITLSPVMNKSQRTHVDIALKVFLFLWFFAIFAEL